MIIIFSVLYLTLMKRFYLQEVICQAFHTNNSKRSKMMCNKTMSTINLLITILLCCLLYVVVFKTIAHIAFNAPLRYLFKLVEFFSFGINLGFYVIMGVVSYFVYHLIVAYMYWNQYDIYMIKNHGWNQSNTAQSVLICFCIIVATFAYYNFVQATF